MSGYPVLVYFESMLNKVNFFSAQSLGTFLVVNQTAILDV